MVATSITGPRSIKLADLSALDFDFVVLVLGAVWDSLADMPALDFVLHVQCRSRLRWRRCTALAFDSGLDNPCSAIIVF